MYKYFANVDTLEELRKQYKKLVKKYHSDNGGDDSILAEVNGEYEKLFKILKNKDHKTSEKKTSGNNNNNNKYDFEVDQKLRDIINQIINYDIDIEIIGNWIWVYNCFNVKDILKGLGFRWASKKKAWYWHEEGYIKTSKRVLDLDQIRSFYGSEEVKKGSGNGGYNKYNRMVLEA